MKRNHNILFLASGAVSAILALGSCENRMGGEETGFTFSAEAVSFDGSANTKAAPVNTVDAFESAYTTFIVSAYAGATAKFTDNTASYSNGEWNLSTSAKWYSGESLDFFAVAPAVGSALSITPASGGTGATASFTYDASAGSDPFISGPAVPDLMFGYYSGLGVVEGNKKIAPLTFYHPLAAVRFIAGDIAGAVVNSIKIKNAAFSGTCTLDCASLGTSADAINWNLGSSLANYGNAYSVTAAQDAPIGTEEQTLMLPPQVLGNQAKLEINLTVPHNGETKDYTLVASLDGVTLEAGKILNIKINYSGILLTDARALIIPYTLASEVHISNPQMVPKYAYLPAGSIFNARLTSLANGRPITKISFDRFSDIDNLPPTDVAQIQDDGLEGGEVIYAQYNNGEITIKTPANTIYLNTDCSAMFKDMALLTEIQWGNFFESEGLTEVKEMFMGCASLQGINLTGVLNTELVTDMSHMFDGCSSADAITLGLEFSADNVTDMSYMYRNCSSAALLTIPKGPNVRDYSYMFYNCTSLTTVSSLNTESAVNLDYMFYGCSHVDRWHTGTHYVISSSQVSGQHMYEGCFPSTRAEMMHATETWLMDPSNNTYFDRSRIGTVVYMD